MNRTIAYITDAHLDEDDAFEKGINPRHHWKKILEDIDARGIEEVIFGGDIGEPSAYRWFFDSLQKYRFNIVLGNHDRYDHVKPFYQSGDSENELYFSDEDEHLKYLFLDSSKNQLSAEQFQWLGEQLKTPKQLVLFIHHPILGVDTAVDTKYPLQGRAELRKLLEDNGAPVTIFTGHYHLHDEQTIGNITQFITPAASFQILRAPKIEIDNSSFGYRIITLTEGGVISEVIEFKTP